MSTIEDTTSNGIRRRCVTVMVKGGKYESIVEANSEDGKWSKRIQKQNARAKELEGQTKE